MRIRFAMAVLFALMIVSAASAQTVDLFVRAVDATKEGKTTVHGGAATVSLNSAHGFEAGADIFWTPQISSELSVSSVPHDLDASAFGQNVDLGGTRDTYFTAVAELHTNPRGAFDVHLGAGAAFARLGDVADTAELTLIVRSIKFHDKIAPVADAGASLRLGPHWAITAAAKWLDLTTKTTATYLDGTTEGANMNLKQITVGVGLAYRF